ncbi:EAL domain-containing protein [Amaricoccus sp.]|uniref:EAL domain-containing protein n=1 Tax=Amaricoccus sp. TaxID=1872485 RepID=UPI001B6E1197|nr:EAL domain-containing protein [Amaricoccus sp.]MBP7242118.1 EAL domain-containing protein [Amaricoccus sp.]
MEPRSASPETLARLRALAAGEPPLAGVAPTESPARVRFAVAQALAQGRVIFHYQPVVRADAPGFPAFFEMLARIALPGDRTLPAAAFMPQVEDGPLGRAVDLLALEAALAALAADPTLRLSVNMSPLSMGDPDWLAAIATAAARDPRVTARLIVEVTETAALATADLTRDFMAHVRGCGCAFALDDFGAGATGFRHFRDFRFDMVKIDGAYVQGVAGSPDSRVLVECLVRLARHFEMTVVAERVESDADVAWLRAAGVDCLQGYRFGRPAALPEMPAAEERRRAG